jgi:phospholipid/cholesterol/gamma-HCH transport system permease protein
LRRCNESLYCWTCHLILFEIINTLYRKGVDPHDIAEQTWKVIEQSFLTVLLAGFFVGAVMTIQFTMQLIEFDSLGYLGGLATSGTIRELGPLLIAFMLSGKVGAFTAAELGTMKVSEQMDAIRCLGADPMREMIAPRFLGIIFASIFLLVIGVFMSIIGGLLMGYLFAGVHFEEYIRNIPTIVQLTQLWEASLKYFAFLVD